MPNEFKIAKKLYYAQQNEERHSRPAVRVALLGMIVGVMVMILTICVVVGFKNTITQKVAGFGAHIQLVSFDNNNTYDLQPIEVPDSLLKALNRFEHVRKVAPFITKPGMIKTDSAFHGIVLKGTDYWGFFGPNIIEGGIPNGPNQIVISRSLANAMQLNVGDAVAAYFVDDTDIRARRFTVTGIYYADFEQFDDLFVITTLRDARRLQGWDPYIFSGVEILVDDMQYLNETADAIYFATVNHMDGNGYHAYYVQTLQEQNPAIFAWLDLLDMNVIVIIVLMLLVAGFNMVSGLIILILDGVQVIGTLKALGADNRFVRRVFLGQAAMLVGKGVLYGNCLGFILASIQYKYHFIPLDATTYYVDYVPIDFAWGWLLAINVLTIVVSLLILLLPSLIITKISPAKVMHFE